MRSGQGRKIKRERKRKSAKVQLCLGRRAMRGILRTLLFYD
jgi:hypothetical protein